MDSHYRSKHNQKKAERGTTTDFDGMFSISASEGEILNVFFMSSVICQDYH
jgi:hypothetical protein